MARRMETATTRANKELGRELRAAFKGVTTGNIEARKFNIAKCKDGSQRVSWLYGPTRGAVAEWLRARDDVRGVAVVPAGVTFRYVERPQEPDGRVRVNGVVYERSGNGNTMADWARR